MNGRIYEKWCILVLLFPIYFQSCDECKPDKYGEVLELVVPITTSPSKDTFAIGDTLTIESYFDKDIEIYNASYTIKLDSFTFFGLFGISEVTDTIENYDFSMDTIVEIGQVDYLPLYGNVIAYPINYFEDQTGYHLAFKVVLKARGMFWVRMVSANFFYEESNYDHPALYICESNRRDRVELYFQNPNTSIENYNKVFRKTKVKYLLESVDFDSFQKGGGIGIIVQ